MAVVIGQTTTMENGEKIIIFFKLGFEFEFWRMENIVLEEFSYNYKMIAKEKINSKMRDMIWKRIISMLLLLDVYVSKINVQTHHKCIVQIAHQKQSSTK